MSGASSIRYIVGDATRPVGTGNRIIAHICNDIGSWGAGFVLAISKRWPEPKAQYRRIQSALALGMVQMVQVENEIWVANMVAQHDIREHDGVPPLRYSALKECLAAVAHDAGKLNASIHMPRIGCGLAGGKWDLVEPIIRQQLHGLQVFVYDLPR